MEGILKSVLETEREAEKILAEAKWTAQKMSQEANESAQRLKLACEKALREKMDAYLSEKRQEATGVKAKILAQAQTQAQDLDRQAEARMPEAVEDTLNRLLPTMQ